MNVGEKVCLYKERLKHRSFQDFGRAANCSGSWLNDISKKEEIKQVNDMDNLINLCNYLGLTVNQFLKNDENEIEASKENKEICINNDSIDIGVLIDQIVILLNKDGIKIGGQLMTDKSKQICKDSLEVVKMLSKQYL